jgi:hypothetical protein
VENAIFNCGYYIYGKFSIFVVFRHVTFVPIFEVFPFIFKKRGFGNSKTIRKGISHGFHRFARIGIKNPTMVKCSPACPQEGRFFVAAARLLRMTLLTVDLRRKHRLGPTPNDQILSKTKNPAGFHVQREGGGREKFMDRA